MKHILDTKDFSSFERTFLRLSTEAEFLLIESGIYGNEGEEGTIHHHYVNSKQIDELLVRLQDLQNEISRYKRGIDN